MDTRREDIRLATITPTNESQAENGAPTTYEPQKERRVKWKLDLTILPLLSSIQFLSQMARSDLGNAKVAGLDDELQLSAKEYSNVAIMLLVGYVLFQLPGTMLLRKIGPSIQFGGAMILWGVFTTSLVTVHTVAPFMVLRALIGAAEAFIQGSIVYLSFWYRYEELATRGAIFFSTAALAGAFNGIISHSIQANLDGVNGWSPWRWIFLIEGVIPIGWGFVVAALLPGTPDNVRGIFSSAEKDIIVRRSRAAHNTGDSKIRLKAILQVLMDPTFWMLVGINAGIHFSVDSLPNFLPAILDEIGWKDQQAQLMSSIVYACAFVTTIGCAKVADRTGRRGLTIIACSCVGITGFVLLLTISSPIGRLVATCLVAMAVYPCIVLTLVWMALTTVGYSHRTSAAALINIAGQLFSIIGNVVYVDPPLYHRGLAVSAGMLAMSGIFAAGLIWRLSLLNKRKEDGKNTPHGLEQAKKSIDEIGNRHPRFMYGY